jgi:hypothetical protein
MGDEFQRKVLADVREKTIVACVDGRAALRA